MLRKVCVLGVLAVGVIFAPLSSAAGQEPVQQDISIEIRILEGETLSSATPEAQDPWLDGSSRTYEIIPTNHGTQTEQIRFWWSERNDPGPFGDPRFDVLRSSGAGYHQDQDMRCSALRDFCDVVLEGGESHGVFIFVYAVAPGTSWFTARVTETEFEDPDPSNDTVTEKRVARCSIEGSRKDDVLSGTGRRREWICGGDGRDRLRAGTEDYIFGGDGRDFLVGNNQYQGLFGGAGYDTISYRNSNEAILIDWNKSPGITGSGGDLVFLVEKVIGSRFADEYRGNEKPETFLGLGGADRFDGRGGQDHAQGGAGADRFDVEGGGRDTVLGGRGKDRAIADPFDKVRSARRVATLR